MTETVSDPVSRTRYAFEPDGDDMIVYVWLEPGGALPPHLHPRQTERWSVLEGEVSFQHGDDKRLLTPADGEIPVSPNTKHGLESVGDREARLRCVVVPALDIQPFLEESARAARDGLIMRGGIPRGLRGARWAARFLKKYGEETVFLSPPRVVQRTLIALLARDT